MSGIVIRESRLSPSRRFRNRDFTRFVISFLAILAIPLSLGGFLYWESLRVIGQGELETRISMLQQRKLVLDAYLADAELTVVRMSLDSALEKTLYVEPVTYGTTSIIDILETQKRLKTYTYPRTIDARPVIYLRGPDVILDGEFAYFGGHWYFSNRLIYDGYEFDHFFHEILASRHDRLILPATRVEGRLEVDVDVISTREYLTVVTSLPYGGGTAATAGALLLLIDAEGINRILQGGVVSDEGSTYLLDRDGRIVVGPHDRPEPIVGPWTSENEATTVAYADVDENRTVAIYVQSEFRDWTYVTLMPKSAVAEQTSRMRVLIFFVLGVSVIVGLATAVVLTDRRLRPLKEIGNLLRPAGERDHQSGSFDYVRTGVQRIITANEKLADEVSTEREALSDAVLRRLLSYDANDESEIQDSLAQISFHITGRRFVAIVCEVDQTDWDGFRDLTAEGAQILRSSIGESGGVFEWEDNRWVVLLGFDNSDEMYCTNRVNGMIEAVRRRMDPNVNERVYIGIGGLCSSLIDLRLSFAQATDAIEILVEGESDRNDLWYRDIKTSGTGFHYPVGAEQRLVTMATCGNRHEVMKTLSQIYGDNFTDRKLMPYMRRQLHHELHGTLVKVRDELGMESIEGDAELTRSIDRDGELFFANLQAAYLRICDAVDEAKRSHNSALAQEVVAFTRKNFRSPTFGACTVAREYGLSDSYFSRFFKEQVGERFIDYLQELRIRAACELIDSGGLTLQAVAREVGYGTSQSFRRGFKKVVGVLPTEYQKRRTTSQDRVS